MRGLGGSRVVLRVAKRPGMEDEDVLRAEGEAEEVGAWHGALGGVACAHPLHAHIPSLKHEARRGSRGERGASEGGVRDADVCTHVQEAEDDDEDEVDDEDDEYVDSSEKAK